jgi:universal stress protein E
VKKFKRILVAVKNPDARRQEPVAKAVDLARQLGASVQLFHALSTQAFFEVKGLRSNSMPALRREVLERRRARLEVMAAAARRDGVRADVSIGWDHPPHEAILRAARGQGADLIVVAAHEGSRTGSWFLRLTDWELLRHSPVPVLVLRSTRRWKRPTVLAAVDPSHARAKPAKLDPEIVAQAKTLARALGGRVELVHANRPDYHGSSTRPWER